MERAADERGGGSDDRVSAAVSDLVTRCLGDVDERPAEWSGHVRVLRDDLHGLRRLVG